MDSKHKARQMYLIPGLGTDIQLFDQFDPKKDHQRLDWIRPNHDQEPLRDYASRIAESIPDHSVPFILGVSFGGVIAQEIARIRPVSGLILVSSLVSPAERPFWMNLFRKLPLYKLGRGEWRIKSLPIWSRAWGIHDKKEQIVLQNMFSRADDSVRMWSMEQLALWKGGKLDCPVLRLHGTRDGLFSVKNEENCRILAGATHFMIWQRANELRQEIDEWVRETREELM